MKKQYEQLPYVKNKNTAEYKPANSRACAGYSYLAPRNLISSYLSFSALFILLIKKLFTKFGNHNTAPNILIVVYNDLNNINNIGVPTEIANTIKPKIHKNHPRAICGMNNKNIVGIINKKYDEIYADITAPNITINLIYVRRFNVVNNVNNPVRIG